MLHAIRKRRSIRKYTSQDVADEQVDQIVHSAMFAPSAWDRRPWHFIVVRDKETLKKLGDTHQWSGFVADAPVAIVVCGDKEQSEFWIEDCSIAGEHISLAVASMGLGTCWTQVRLDKHGEEDAEDYVRRVLAIPPLFGVLCMFPIGYPAEDLPPHSEAEIDHGKVSWEMFGHRSLAD